MSEIKYHRTPKIYIAGKLNDMAVDYIKNVHKMIQCSEIVRKAGFAVFVPAIDVLNGFVHGDWEYKDYFDNSQPWLLAADAIFLCPGWESSKGTQREKALAQEHEIPTFDDLEKMKIYFKDRLCT